MSEFVKKGALGGYKAVQGGQSDPECTHVILTLAEYNELLEDIQTAERNEVEAKRKAAAQVENAIATGAKSAKEAEKAAEQRVAAMQESLDTEKRRKNIRRD